MILKKLIDGHIQFKEKKVPKWEDDLKDLVKYGQKPEVLFIGCSDSRITPDLMLNIRPGEMFLLRNVGNFIPPFKDDEDFHGTAAGIEYASSVLKVKHIIVCGHSHCGACKSLYEDIPNTKEYVHVKTWLKLGERAKQITLEKNEFKTEEQMYRETEKNSLKIQLKNLLTYPEVVKLLKEGKLNIHGWYYDIKYGHIDFYDEKNDEFKPLEELNYE